MTRNRAALIALLSAQLIYLGFHLVYGRFIGWDEMGYKAVGRGWAVTGRWIAPELEGAYWPLSWHCHPPAPPLYSLGFGIVVRLFGLSLRTNAMYDAVIQVLLSWIVFAIARMLDRAGPLWPAAAAAIAVLPLGNPGRPEAMGMVFGYAGWLLSRRDDASARDWLGAGLLEGFAASTSLACGVFIGVLTLLRRNRVRNIVVWAAAAAAVFVPIMLVLNWEVMTQSSSGIAGMASAAASRSWTWIAGAFRFGRTAGWGLIAMLIPIALAGWRQRRLWIVPLAIQIAIPLLFPREFYYIWILAPVMLAIAAIVIQRAPRPALVALVTLPMYLFAISRVMLLHLAMATLPPDQRLEANLPLIRSTIPKTSTIMTYDFWPALGNDYRLYSTDARPDWRTVDYIVLTGNGSGTAGKRQLLPDDRDDHIQREYVVVSDRLNRVPFHIGSFHTNSAYGFGPLILRRIRRPGESNESSGAHTACWP